MPGFLNLEIIAINVECDNYDVANYLSLNHSNFSLVLTISN